MSNTDGRTASAVREEKIAACTPGPWVVRRNDSGDLGVCTNEPEPWWIAEMCLGAGFDAPVDPAEANARLIAAAPDAIEFARFYDAYMSEQFPGGLQPAYDSNLLHPKAAEAWGRCKTFLAKATGGAQ